MVGAFKLENDCIEVIIHETLFYARLNLCFEGKGIGENGLDGSLRPVESVAKLTLT